MSAPSHDVSCLVLPIFICFFVATQDCAKRVADADLEKRTQAEKDAQQKKQLSKERDAALVAVNGVYLCDRASHKAVANSINSAAEVEKHARLVHGAVREVARVAARAVAASPADQRAEFKAALQRASMALSASEQGLHQAVKDAEHELVGASVLVREHNKGVHAHRILTDSYLKRYVFETPCFEFLYY